MSGMGLGAQTHPFVQPSTKPLGKAKDYKESDSAIKFDSFNGQKDKFNAFTFIQ